MVVHRVGFPVAGVIPLVDMVRCPTAAGAADWWDPDGEGLCIWSAYQPKGAASLAASYLDLSGNGNNAGPGVAPTWDAVNGWKFNGSTQYLTTTFVGQNDQSQSILVQYTNLSGATGALVGARSGAGNLNIILSGNYLGSQCLYSNGGLVGKVPTHTVGNLGLAGNLGYRDGVDESVAIGAWAGASTAALWIAARNHAGSPLWLCQVYIQALAIYDCALTAPQVASVYAAMAAL